MAKAKKQPQPPNDDPSIRTALNLSYLITPRKVEAHEIDRIMFSKFSRTHDINIITKNNTVYLQVSYSKPYDPISYIEQLNTLTHHINKWGCVHIFKMMVDGAPFPDFVINPETQELIDISVTIDLDIPHP